MIILRGTLPSFSSPVSSFRNGCPCSELVTVAGIVHLCFPWRGCGSGPEKAAFLRWRGGLFIRRARDSGERPGHTSTKGPRPWRTDGAPRARPGVRTKARSKTFSKNSVLEPNQEPSPDLVFSSLPPCPRSPRLFSFPLPLASFLSLQLLRVRASWETCHLTWFPHD